MKSKGEYTYMLTVKYVRERRVGVQQVDLAEELVLHGAVVRFEYLVGIGACLARRKHRRVLTSVKSES